jgi:hypothetical protein
MARPETDRRKNSSELVTRPPSSPANLLVLAAVAVLGASAAAAAFMGGGFEDVTPHGQLLGNLQVVAEAQERHYTQHGSFAVWLRSLDVEPTDPDIRMTLTQGGADRWEAVAYHPVGLTCTREGRIVDGVPLSDRPVCFMTEP